MAENLTPSILNETPLVRSLSEQVIFWYEVHGRKNLPWQNTPDPYAIWVSEVMLQQTQVATVIPYFQAFMNRFPDLKSLAAAERDEVFRLWSGLGYYRRAENLRGAAQKMVALHQGKVPSEWKSLIQLPGIGRNTAAAVLSLAFNQPYPIFDGNVKRVLKRVYAFQPKQVSSEGELWKLAEKQVHLKNPKFYNQGMMDLGALVCLPRKPHCGLCPLRKVCQSHQAYGNQVPALESSAAKKQKPLKSMMMLWIWKGKNKIWMERVPKALGVWSGLWSPKLYLREEDWISDSIIFETYGLKPSVGEVLQQTCTHLTLRFETRHIQIQSEIPTICDEAHGEKGRWFSLDDALEVGVAAVIKKAFDREKRERAYENSLL